MTEVVAAPATAVTVAHGRGELPPWRLLLRRPTFIVGAAILLFWVVCAVFGHMIAPQDPLAQQLLATNKAPSGAHWFGTDQLGRDVFSRVIVGARSILIISFFATLLGTVAGTALGLAMGYLGGVVDMVGGRIVEAVLALPLLVVAFMFVVALGPSPLTIIIVIGFVFTPLIARTVRSAVLVERQQDYLASARLLGENRAYIMFVEVLPNVLPTVLVEFTVRLGYAIFAIADPVVPRLRRAAADPGLGRGHQRELWGTAGRLLVDDAVPGAGHRLAGDSDQPGHRLD